MIDLKRFYLNKPFTFCLLLVLFLIPLVSSAQTYYSQISGTFDDRNNWNSERDNSGSPPPAVANAFTVGSFDFVIQPGNAMTSPASDININNLTIESTGSFDPFDNNIIINGQAQIEGTFMDTSPDGTNVFVGLFHVISGGAMSSTFGTHEYRGGIGNSGMFDVNGATIHNFTTNAQTVSATADIDMRGKTNFQSNVTFSETAAEVSIGSNSSIDILGTATVTNQIATGFLRFEGNAFDIVTGGVYINDANANLSINASNQDISGTFTATASGNTVVYDRVADQDVIAGSYWNLTLTDQGAATQFLRTPGGNLMILGDLQMNGISLDAPVEVRLAGNATASSPSVASNPPTHFFFDGTSAQTFDLGTSTFDVRELTIDNQTIIRSNIEVSDQGINVNSPLTIDNAVLDVSLGNVVIDALITVDNGRLEKPGDANFTTSTSFGTTRMIAIQNGGFVRGDNPTSGDPTLFPVGTGSVYTPATVTTDFNTPSSPYIEVSVDNLEETNVINSGQSLTRYWTINSSGMNIDAATVTMTYDETDDVVGDESLYVPAYFNSAWSIGGVSDVIQANNTATFIQTGVAQLNGTYTAGEAASFLNITYSDLPLSASNMFRNSTSNVLYRFQLNSDVTIDFTGLTFTTSGTYAASDLNGSGIKLYYNTTNSLSGATQFGSGLTGAGTFTSSFSMSSNTDYFFFITSDISGSAVDGHTIDITSIAPVFSAGSITATPIPGIEQTINVVSLGTPVASSNGISAAFDNVGYFYGQVNTEVGKWDADIVNNFYDATAASGIIRGVAIDYMNGEIHVGLKSRKYRITDGLQTGTTTNFSRAAVIDNLGSVIHSQNTDPNIYRNGAIYVSAATLNTNVISANIRGLAITGDILWVGTDNGRLHKLDVSDLSNPVLTESYDASAAGNFSFSGNFGDIAFGDKKLLYIASRGQSKLIAFNTETEVANEVVTLGFSPIALALGPAGEMVISNFTSSYVPINNLLDTRSDIGTPPVITVGGVLSGTNTLYNPATDQILTRFTAAPTNGDGALYEFVASASFTGAASISDLSNFKVWFRTDDSDFSGATQVTSAVVNITGDDVFLSGINQHIDVNTTGYFWLTADVAHSSPGTIQIDPSSIVSADTYVHGVVAGSVSNSPIIQFGVEPATQATNITFSNIGTTQMEVTWANGDGTNRIVVAHAGATVDADPVDQMTYTANAAFGSGSQIGTGNFVVYHGSGSSVSITGLTSGETYHVRVYDYNGTAGDENYNVNTATGNPASQATLTPSLTYSSSVDVTDPTSISNDGSPFSVSGQASIPWKVSFSASGEKMFVVDQNPRFVYQYTLTVPFDVTGGASHDGSFALSGITGSVGLAFNPDGTKMYVLTTTPADQVYQYSLSTPFEVTSGVTLDNTFNLDASGEGTRPRGLTFDRDGTKLYVVEDTHNVINQYSLNTPFDLTAGGTLDSSPFVTSAQDGEPREVLFDVSGYKMYLLGVANNYIYQYSLTVPFETTSGVTYDGRTISTFSGNGMTFNPSLTKLYTIIAGSSLRINQYSLTSNPNPFKEAVNNDGSVLGSLAISIENDTFVNAGGSLTATTHYTVNNLPTSLIPNITVSDDGSTAILTLSGNADAHLDANDLANLQFTFTDAAFTNSTAGDVTNAIAASSNLGIDFLEAEIEVYQGTDNTGTLLVDNVSDLDAGGTAQGTDLDLTIAIENTGLANLNIGSIIVSGTDHTIISAPSTVASGATETFIVRLSGSSIGTFGPRTVTINSDDDDEAAFTFDVTGAVVDPYIVTNTNDSGTGSLRWAVANANASTSKETLSFNLPGLPATWQIDLGSTITINNVNDMGMVIDGTTQGSYVQWQNMIILDGGDGTFAGLTIAEPSVEIYGLYIRNYTGDGIHVDTGSNDIVIGSSTKGNVIAENAGDGIDMQGGSNGFIQGNRIGTSIDGTTADGNRTHGIRLSGWTDLQIGGDRFAGEGNLISGNGMSGTEYAVNISSSTGTLIYGNLIGLDVTGELDRGNNRGVNMAAGSHATEVGGNSSSLGNVISGNNSSYAVIAQSNSDNIIVQNNIIGLDDEGDMAVPNSGRGVGFISNDGDGNIIRNNTISGNTSDGIYLDNVDANPLVQNNYIGTDVNGENDLGNNGSGILIRSGNGDDNGANRIQILNNVISGNGDAINDHGIVFTTGGSNILIQSNRIGVDVNDVALANFGNGIQLIGGVTAIEIGGNGNENIIANNGGSGIYFNGLAATTSGTLIGENSYFCNTGEALDFSLTPTVAAPAISSIFSSTISGSSGSISGTVEVFLIDPSCADNQGATWVESGTINGDGTWSITTNAPYDATATYVAYANDATNGISEFSTSAMNRPFITTWANTGGTIVIPTFGTGYNYTITWTNLDDAGVGDGTATGVGDGNYTISSLDPNDRYQVEIIGAFPRIYINNNGTHRSKLITIEQWGDIQWQDMTRAFMGCNNLISNATDEPDLSAVTSLQSMFRSATIFNADISSWDVSNVQDMSFMFSSASAFNNGGQPLSWGTNTSAVTNMNAMFNGATAFNQPINDWDVSSVENMSFMFQGADAFDQALSGWNVSAVIAMDFMFNNADLFNQDVGDWNVSSVQNMELMFANTIAFNNGNQPLDWENSGNTGMVTDMRAMFSEADAFNQDVSGWDVSLVQDMSGMFSGADVFNNGGQILDWGANTGAVTTMNTMFYNTPVFNQDISGWDVGMVGDMSQMFQLAGAFNNGGQALSWGNNTGQVTTMRQMFSGVSIFNQDVSDWDVSMVGDMNSMFFQATAFDQSLGNWDISSASNISGMLSNSGLSTANYDVTLIGWEAQNPPTGLILGATGLTFCAGATAHAELQNVGTHNWTISDAGEVCSSPTMQASSLSFTNIGATSMTINWANGNGSARIVVARQGADPDVNPTDLTTYSANSAFGSGGVLGSGFAVYNGVENSVDVTNLNENTTYHFQVFEYDGSTGAEAYNVLTDTDNPNSQTTNESDGMPQGLTGLYLDGEDDYVDVGDIDALDGVGQMTIEAWVKVEDLNSVTNLGIVDKGTSGTTRFGMLIGGSGTSIPHEVRVNLENGSDAHGTTTSQPLLGQENTWVHLAMVFEGAGATNADRLKLFIDGTNEPLSFAGTIPATTHINSAPVEIGKTYLPQFFKGQIDEVKIFDVARTQSEIQADMYTTSLSGANLVGYWNFNDDLTAGNQTIAADGSGNNNNGTLTNGPLWSHRVINTDDSGDGSLRAAITSSNTDTDVDFIDFSIPTADGGYSIDAGNETWTMSLTTDLPDITEQVVLDATTQPGTGNFRIVLSNAAAVTNGFNITTGGCEIYGFYLTGFTNGIEIIHLGSNPATIGAVGKGNTIVNCIRGIRSQLVDGHIIHGNYIGTDENGSSGLGNTTGISFPSSSSGHFVGGTNAGERNVISGNSGTGISLNVAGGTQIVGNYIGTDPTGMLALPNNQGINVGNSNGTQITDNVISGNTNYAIHLNVSSNCIIRGNNIGVAFDGTTALGNGLGIEFLNAGNIDGNIIGGIADGESNIIANNTGAAVLMNNANADNNSVIGNSIYCNGSGIDLGGLGNNDIQPPLVTNITATSITGTGTSGEDIHVYRDNSGCSPSQGQEYLGTATVDGGGDWSVGSLTINPGSDKITFTATNATDGTSEFSLIPESPENLFVQEISSTQINLTWVDNSTNEDGFTIERATDYGFTQNLVTYNVGSNAGATGTFSNTTTLTSETAYFYRVQATNTGGSSGYSNVKAGTTITLPGNALDFDGVNDIVIISESPELDFQTGDSFSMEAWVKTTNNSSPMFIAGKHLAGSFNGYNFIMNGTDPAYCNTPGHINFYVASGSGSDACSDIDISDGLWHHVAGTYDHGLNQAKLYIDGVLQSDVGQSDGALDNSQDFTIGDLPGFNLPFEGEIDELRVWDDVRMESEIQSNMFTTQVGNEENLVSYHRFDQGIAHSDNNSPVVVNVLPDRSQNQNDGILNTFILNGDASNWVDSEALVPSAPTNLLTTEVSNSQIDLAWDDNSFNENGFTIERATDYGFTENMVTYNVSANAGSTGTFSNTTTLSSENSYFYRVKATNAGGESGYSNIKAGNTITPSGNVLDFDGTSNYVNLGDPSAVDFGSGDFTMELWFRATDLTPSSRYLVSKDLAGQRQFGFQFDRDFTGNNKNLTILMYRDNDSFSGLDSDANAITDTNWHHVAALRRGNSFEIYVDGVLIKSGVNLGTSGGTMASSTSDFLIGANSALTAFAQGQIDELRIWSEAKTQLDIQNGMYSVLAGNEANLVAYYRFDQGVANGSNTSPSVNILPDRSQNQNDGSLNGFALNGGTSNWVESNAQRPVIFDATNITAAGFTANWQAVAGATDILVQVDDDPNFGSPLVDDLSIATGGTAPVMAAFSPGLYYYRIKVDIGGNTSIYSLSSMFVVPPGNALHFDGSNDQVTIGNPSELQITGNLTIEAWFKVDGPQSLFSTIAGKWSTGGSNASYVLGIYGNSLTFGLTSAGGSNQGINSGSDHNDGLWHHVAGVWDGTTMRLYVDGCEVASNAPAGFGTISNTTLDFIIGADASGQTNRFFDGQIDEVRVWSEARSETNLRSNLFSELVGNETNLRAYYRFDESGSTINLPDVTANLNDGIFTGGSPQWVASGAFTQFIPKAATNLVTAEVSSSQIDLTWADNSYNEDGFTIERATDYNFTQNLVTYNVGSNSGATGTFSNTTTLTSETAYFYRVKATNSIGESDYSNTKAGTTITPSGNALDFDGFDNFIDFPGLPGVMAGNESNFAVEFWANIADIHTGTNGGALLSVNTPTGGNAFLIFVGSSLDLGFDNQLTISDISARDIFGTVVGDNTWHHIAYSRQGSTGSLYMDGLLIGTHTADFVLSSNDLWTFGQDYDPPLTASDFLDGSIDELRIWKTSRSEAEIRNDMLAVLLGNEPDLAAYYRFDQGIASGNNTSPAVNILPDRSQNQNDGSLNGFVLNGTVSNWVDSDRAPEIEVYAGVDNTGTLLSNDQIAPVRFGHTDLGVDRDIVFAIENTGADVLSIDAITVAGNSFSVISAPTSVALAATENFTVRLSGSIKGIYNDFVTIGSDDADEATYTFPVTGTVGDLDPKVYWTDDIAFPAEDQIDRTNLDGSGFQQYYEGFEPQISGIAIDTLNNMIFWTSSSQARIMCGRMGEYGFTAEGGPIIDEIGGSARAYKGLDVDGQNQKIYFTSPWNGQIRRIDFDGTNDETLVNIVGAEDVALDLASGKMYYIVNTPTPEIHRANLDGTGQELLYFSGTTVFKSLALDLSNGHIYWTQSIGGISRCDLDGSNVISVSSTPVDPEGMAINVQEQKIYYVENNGPTISRINFDGSGFEVIQTGSNLILPVDIAVDTRFTVLAPEIAVFNGADNSGMEITNGQTVVSDFGTSLIGNDISMAFAIENSGTELLNITDISVSGSDFSITSSITSIAVGATESFTVTFSGGSVGMFNSTVTITNDDSDEGVFSFPIVGEITNLIGGVLASDYNALVALYNATDGSNWNNNTNWLSANPVSTWFGVTVVGNRVTEVILEINNLNGTLPTEIGDLSALTQLDLETNSITGSIPTEIGGLGLINDLDLENNQLTGNIPSTIWNLTNLTELNLDLNLFTGTIPTDVGNLTQLIVLDLGGNQLTGGIPVEIWSLTDLLYLYLENNMLTGSISSDIGNLTQLIEIQLNGNQFDGTIPIEMGTSLLNLQYIDLTDNQFTGSIPTEFENLTSLLYLYLGENQLTGEIPSELGSITSLMELRLNVNQLSGSIPSELGSLVNLTDLILYTNQLTGSIPTQLGNLTNLNDVVLSHNQLTGDIPIEIGQLILLTDLELDDNQLTGTIPTELGSLVLLDDLQLDINQLTGAVPSSLVNLTSLTNFEINDNLLADLPDLSGLTNITAINISSNNFHFDDVEPNLSLGGIVYSPQNQVPGLGTIGLVEGDPLNLSVPVGGSSNQYQWVKDATNIPGETNDSFSITSVIPADAGTYHLTISNTLVPGLTLRSDDITVGVTFPEIGVFVGSDNTGTFITNAQSTSIDIGSAVEGNDIVQIFAIENTGTSTLTISSIGSSSTEYIISSVPSSIAVGSIETFTATLDGTTPGTFNTTITIASDDSDENPFTFPLTGSIVAPEIDLFVGSDNTGTPITDAQATSIDIGAAVEGNDIVQTFAVENTGTSTLTISSIGSSATEYTVSSVPSSIAAGSTETFTITLDGTTPGTFNTTVTIASDDSDENPFTFDVTGAITSPEISIFLGSDNSGTAITAGQTGSIDYGSAIVGNDIVQTFAIENTGSSDLNISGITSTSTDFTVNSAITSISVGSTETFEVSLSGANVGTFNTTITVASDDSDEALFDFSITGTINSPPEPEINVFVGNDNSGVAITDNQAAVIDFGSEVLGTSISQTFAIENTGTLDLSIANISVSGTDFSTTNSISSIAGGATETFDVVLSGLVAGTFDATVTIENNDSDEAMFTFPVTGMIQGLNIIDGEDTDGDVIISNQEVDLGATLVNEDIEKPFVIENLNDTQDLIINSVVSDNPLFEVINPPSTVSANSFAQFTVRLVATTPGIHNARIMVSTGLNDFEFVVTGEVLEGAPPDVIVFNAVTPNGDGVHDFMKVENILFYPNNQVTIIKRNGDRVFEAIGYDNNGVRFEGRSNIGGTEDLNSGNYIYTIDKGDGYGKVSGFIFIKR